MLTTFAEMQELGRQVESVSSHSKVSILYSVSCRADLSERSILNYTIPQSASLPQMSFLTLKPICRYRRCLKVMLHGTIRKG